MTAWRVSLLAALSACTAAAPRAVLERTDPASVVDCPYGGTLVRAGRDANGDGVLQDAEVAVRTPVCDPPSPSGILLRLRAEPAGLHCRAGGTAVQLGTDANRNGTLDDAEVVRTDYLCREALVTRVAAEPPGANCRDGGVAFFAGVDRDGDGMLDDAEIQRTDFACGDIIARDVTIHSDAEAAALAQVRFINGDVTVQLTGFRALSLPQLERIGGALQVIDNPQLTRLAMPALQWVEGGVTLRANGLTTVTFPQLRHVGSLDLEMLSLASLAGLGALDVVDGPVRITGLPALLALELPQATRIGDLSITANAALLHAAWDITDHIGNIDIRGNPQLETVDISTNTFFGGPTEAGAVTVTSNPALGHLALLARKIESFAIGGEPLLTDISVEALTIVHDVTIVDVTSPFSLRLAGHFGRMTIGGALTIAGLAVEFDPRDGIDVRRFVLDGTNLQTLARFEGSLRVTESLRVSNNPQLADLSAFLLAGDLEVTGNAALTSVNFENASGDEMGGLVLRDNPMLATTPTLALITQVRGAIDIERNRRLAAVFGPGLLRVEGSMRVHDNAALSALAFPALELVGPSLELSANAALHHLDLAALGHVDDFRVDDNPHLPTCEVLAIFDHTTGAHEQSGNDDSAVCE